MGVAVAVHSVADAVIVAVDCMGLVVYHHRAVESHRSVCMVMVSEVFAHRTRHVLQVVAPRSRWLSPCSKPVSSIWITLQ